MAVRRFTLLVVIFGAVLGASAASGIEIPIPDDIPDRFPDIPDHFPELPTIPPNIFENLSISLACDKALAEMFDDQRSQDATLALDACGKPQPGFLAGNLAWLGHYPECKSLEDFHFCTVNLKLNITFAVSPTMRWGLCLPADCSETDVATSLTTIIDRLDYEELESVNPQVSRVYCATYPSRPFDAGFYATVSLCCMAAVLMIAGGLLDAYLMRRKEEPLDESEVLSLLDHEKHQNGGLSTSATFSDDKIKGRPGCCQRFLLCFSFTRNLNQVLDTSTKDGNMLCLNGIRVISLTWVILGHTVMLIYLTVGFAWDGIYGLEWIKTFPGQAVFNAFPAVDSFFLLSGLLLTYISLGRMSRSGGKLPWGMFYFHRYWRLLPGLGFAMLFALYLRPYFAEGPMATQLSRISNGCDKYWWANLLYINNFYPENASSGCIYWAWYLANDMQFYLISPVILIALHRRPKVGLTILAVLCVASLATTVALMVVNDFDVALMGALDTSHAPGQNVLSVVYVKPYCRITPYLVGMALGYAFNTWRGKRVRISTPMAVIGWMVAVATGMAVVYGLYGEYHGQPLSTAANAIYMAMGHLAWACALAWVIFACHYGCGGWVNDFLSWKAWIPLCRLTYGAYLFHPLVMEIFVANTAHAFHFNSVFIAYYFVGCCIFSYLISLLVSLAFELPMANLESKSK